MAKAIKIIGGNMISVKMQSDFIRIAPWVPLPPVIFPPKEKSELKLHSN